MTCRHRFIVPIYENAVTLIVTDDLQKERNRYDRKFGHFDSDPGARGLVTSGGGHCLLILTRRGCAHGQIAHEIFHLAHRIMEWTGDRFDDDHSEPAAYLVQWLTKRVYGRLREWRIAVK